ncbi:Rrf2 family transcriptional regulator, partial [Streptococcus danieliae]|nr:Rrf2 family transcriptional regulator [Streptococcus danieliae]
MHLTKGTEQAICIMILLYIQDRNIYLSSKEISERLDIS